MQNPNAGHGHSFTRTHKHMLMLHMLRSCYEVCAVSVQHLFFHLTPDAGSAFNRHTEGKPRCHLLPVQQRKEAGSCSAAEKIIQDESEDT